MQYRVTDAEYAQLHEWLRIYINEHCLVRNTVMPGKTPGTTYTWMFYLRRGLFNPEFMLAVAKMFIYRMERISPTMDFQVTGLETAATPMVLGISMVSKLYNLDINAYVVRKHRKSYGLLNAIEGIPNEKLSIIVDDLCNSGRSMAQCFETLDKEGIPVATLAFSIVNKSNRGVHDEKRHNTDMYLPEGMQVISLFTLDDFGLDDPSH